MKTKIITMLVTIALMVATNFTALGQQTAQNTAKAELSVEVDPSTFVFRGYGVHIRYKPKNCNHLLLGVGAYAMDMPKMLIDMNSNNKNKGWAVRINNAVGLFAEHHFSEVNKKWFVGLQAGVQQFKISNDFETDNQKYTNGLALVYGGYTWQPWQSGFYIKPWAGVGYTSKIGGSSSLGTKKYDIAPITMFATLHLGYTF